MTTSIAVRAATERDIPLLSEARRLMFEDMAVPTDDHTYEPAFLRYLADGMAEESVGGWVAHEGDEWAGALSVAWITWAPGPGNPDGKRAYLFGLYVRPEYRRRGVAKRLVQTAVDAARERDVRVVVLHASSMGRPMYEGMGFESSPEMRLYL